MSVSVQTATRVEIPRLETERLVLRAPEPGDFDAYAAFFASPRADLERGRMDRDGAWGAFAKAAATWIFDGYGAFSVAERESGAYLGEVGMFREAHYPEAELGWMLIAGAEGRGYAEEAARAARLWAAERGIHRPVSYIHPENHRSIRLAERLGARPDPVAPLPVGWTAATTLAYRHPGAGARP